MPGAPKVVLWRRMYDPSGHEQLQAAGAQVDVVDTSDRSELLSRLSDAQALWIKSPERADAEVFAAGSALRLVVTSGFGIDNIDLHAANTHGVVVANNPGFGRVPVAEHLIMLTLAVARRLTQSNQAVREGRSWAFRSGLDAIELNGRTVGIIGFGSIGAETAHRLHAAFGCRIIAFDPHKTIDAPYATQVPVLDDLLRESDILLLCATLDAGNRHLIGARELALMPQGSIVINAARGGLLDLDALTEAVRSGHLRGAGLDVTDPEPLPVDHALLDLPNVILTPHVAIATRDTARAMTVSAVEQIIDGIRGRLPRHALNPEAWRPERL